MSKYLDLFLHKDLLSSMTESQQILEAKYLQEMRNYDTMAIQVDYERRSIRRKRQALLDKQISLERREKALKLLSSVKNVEDDGLLVYKEKEEIEKLQNKIASVRNEIEQQYSILNNLKFQQKKVEPKANVKSNNNCYLNNFKKNYNSPADHIDENIHDNYSFFQESLTQKQKELMEKRKEIEFRAIEAQRILAEPLDDTILDEILLHDIEEDAQMAESQYNDMRKIDESENYKSIESIYHEMGQLESSNRIRRKDLLAKKNQIQNEMKQYKFKKPVFSPYPSIAQKKIEIDISSAIKKEKVDDIINEICNALTERQKKISQTQRAIDELEKKNRTEREKSEKEWNNKLSKIKNQTTTLREIEQLIISIADLKEKIENMRQMLASQKNEKKKIQRRIETALRDKDYNSVKSQEHRELLAKLDKKKIELNQRNEKIHQRAMEIEKERAVIIAAEETMKMNEEKVEKLETQLLDLVKKNDDVIAKIQENQAQCDATRIAYISKIKDDNFCLSNLQF